MLRKKDRISWLHMSGLANREGFLDRLGRAGEVSIAVIGRKTGKKISTPVWFVLDGEERNVILVPMHGSSTNWFKNLAKDSRIELRIDENAIPLKARLVRDSKEVERVLDRFRAKYKSAWSESYYTKRDVYVEVTV